MLRKYTAKLALPAALIIAAPVMAQDPLIEEIVVTATKRPQTLQEVPVAVSVVDSATMERAQVLDIQDLQGLVPSLRVTQLQTSGNTNFLIRGFETRGFFSAREMLENLSEEVLVPAGTFTMGSPSSEPGRDDDETLHEVTLHAPYYLMVTPLDEAKVATRQDADHALGIVDDRQTGDAAARHPAETSGRGSRRSGHQHAEPDRGDAGEDAARRRSATRSVIEDGSLTLRVGPQPVDIALQPGVGQPVENPV